MSSKINFRPWVGNQYARGVNGIRTLILGESHYQWNCDRDINTWLDITRVLVQEQIDGAYSKAFWTKIAIAFLGRTPSLADKAEFWNSVAFYNYVQVSAGNGPRIAPAGESWDTSAMAFKEVLEDLSPHFILVLGDRLWSRLPKLGQIAGAEVNGAPRSSTWLFPFIKGAALAYGIKHPSTGFNGRTWNPYIKRAMAIAEQSASCNPLPVAVYR